jgi:hypothetical protein
MAGDLWSGSEDGSGRVADAEYQAPQTDVPVDFILVSLGIALVLWLIANRLLVSNSGVSAITDNRVEFTYAFDVAVNSFFPAFLTTYVALMPLAALVVRDNWICLFLGKCVSP